MRKVIISSIFALAATFIFTPANLQASEINVTINGTPFDFGDHPPTISPAGRTLVYIHSDILEHLGLAMYEFNWNEDVWDTPPAIRLINNAGRGYWFFTETYNGQAMVVLRQVAQWAGYFVGWDGDTSTVIISPEPLSAPIGENIIIGGMPVSIHITDLPFLGRGMELQDEDIELLRYMPRLESLEIVNTVIYSLEPLAGLTNLRSLTLHLNGAIDDLSPLAGLVNLEHLRISGTLATDFSPLAGLPNLRSLLLFSEHLDNADMEMIGNFVYLEEMNISGGFDDLSPMAGLYNLQSLIIQSSFQVSDIAPLAELTNLTYLRMSGTQVSDISPLAGLTNLETLRLGFNLVNDITPLAGLTENLRTIHLDSNRITDISPLAGFSDETRLQLIDNPIEDWSPVAHIERVIGRRILPDGTTIGTPRFVTIRGEEFSTHATSLVLGSEGMQNEDIVPLRYMWFLENLEIRSPGYIDDLTPLLGLPSLYRLVIFDNQIKDISPLAYLENLKHLQLDGNPVEDWSVVEHLENVGGRP